MSKLLKLKKWVTIPDAVKHLSEIFDEPVSKADILQLALEERLKLSVYFPNGANAQLGKVIPFRDVPIKTLPSLDGTTLLHITPNSFVLNELEDGEKLTEEEVAKVGIAKGNFHAAA